MAASYPDYCLLPRDPTDERFALSFDVTDIALALQFFQEYGFVVIREVFTDTECAQTREAMWTIIETANPGFVRDDVSTWDIMKASGKYGLSTRGPSFDRALVENRQNPLLAAALAALVGTTMEDTVVSHDRFTIYRATAPSGEDGQGPLDGSKYVTGERNVHLDLNPWWWLESSEDILAGLETLSYDNPQDFIRENNMVVQCMGRHVQCVLNFLDNAEEDGGTVIVPKFHRHVSQWCEERAHLRKPLPFLTFEKSSGGRDKNKNTSTTPTTSCTKKEITGDGEAHIDGDQGISLGSSRGIGGGGRGAPGGRVGGSTGKVKGKQKGLQQRGKALRLSVDEEAPLLALAHRVPMRQGSVLVWDQTVFHGSSPNSSSACRMAQFLKAYPRREAFSRRPNAAPGGEGSQGEEDEYGIEKEPQADPSPIRPPPQTFPVCTVGVTSPVRTVAEPSARLLRRAVALRRELELAGSLECVTPLGRSLFCLDVLS